MQDYKSLSEIVIDALTLHSTYELPNLNLGHPSKRVVIASGNALPTGKIIFKDEPAIFADEGQYPSMLDSDKDIRDAVVISASGKKHAPIIISDLLSKGITSYLLTCDANSPAANIMKAKNLGHRVKVTKSNPEPITYNTSTYLGMILAKTRENPMEILNNITTLNPIIPENLSYPRAFYFIVPPEFDITREMFVTKFDELFGPMKVGRCYTSEQTRHAKTVIPSDEEMFISLGIENNLFGEKNMRFNVPLRKNVGFAEVIAIGYYLIGKIQEQNPPYFKDNAYSYKEFQQRLFDEEFFKNGMKRLEI